MKVFHINYSAGPRAYDEATVEFNELPPGMYMMDSTAEGCPIMCGPFESREATEEHVLDIHDYERLVTIAQPSEAVVVNNKFLWSA